MVLGCLRVSWNIFKPVCFPKKQDPGNAREKALADCKAQLHIVRERFLKQRTAVSISKEGYDRAAEKLLQLEDEGAKLDLLQYRELGSSHAVFSKGGLCSWAWSPCRRGSV